MTDILAGGSDRFRRPRRRPRSQPPRLLLVGVALASVVLAAVVALVGGGGDDPRPAAPPTGVTPTADAPAAAPADCPASPPVGPPAVTTGLALRGVPLEPGGTLESCDRTATAGAWTVVVRRAGGSLGRQGAVVTFPVEAPTAGRAVRVGPVLGRAVDGMVTWPVAGGHGRVRGDLTGSELGEIAARTSVVAGRPVVRARAGYRVAWSGPYRPPVMREVRYGSSDVGEGAALGDGLTFFGVASGGGIEDQLYAQHRTRVGPVDGRPAVVSRVLGGSAALAWEPTAGVVAYVGYSGAALDGPAIAALRRLADRARVVTGGEWRRTRPRVLDRVNEPG